MISPLQESSRSYEKSANAVGKLLREHQQAMACRDIEELIEVGLGLFASYERIDARWRAGVRRGDPAFPIEHGVALREIAQTCSDARAIVIELIRSIESAGYSPEGATQFKSIAFVPFDDRPLDVHFTDVELHSLSSIEAKAPEIAYPEDDSD